MQTTLMSTGRSRILRGNTYHDTFPDNARNLVWKPRRQMDEALSQVAVLIMPASPKKGRALPSVNMSLKGNVL